VTVIDVGERDQRQALLRNIREEAEEAATYYRALRKQRIPRKACREITGCWVLAPIESADLITDIDDG